MLNAVTIQLNKIDLKKSIAAMAKDDKMIDLPIFAILRETIEKCLADYPDFKMHDIKFDGLDIDADIVEAVVYFKPDVMN